MPRPRSEATTEAKRQLLRRLAEGRFLPGDRFHSNRAVARIFGISYQTAHRLLDELVAEGRLRRAPSSGTYVAGQVERLEGVELFFHSRARRVGSFGHRLLKFLSVALEREGIPVELRRNPGSRPHPQFYPIVWDCPEVLDALAGTGRYALLLHQEPPPGLRASFVDSVSIDDFSGGVAAAEWLALRGDFPNVRLLAGPREDPRSRRRVEGFLSACSGARVSWCAGWYIEDGLLAARRVASADAVFCGNDRLAEALIRHCRENGKTVPEIIGFDDAPVASELGFSTVAIPWEETAAAAVKIALRRLAGEPHPAARLVISPRPLTRHLRDELT